MTLHSDCFTWVSILSFHFKGFETKNWNIKQFLQEDCVFAWLFSCTLLFVSPWIVAHKSPLFMGLFQARILEWVATSLSRGSSWPRDQTCISCDPCIAGGFFPHWATGEATRRLLLCYCSVAKSCPTLLDPMCCSTPGSLSLTISWSLSKFMWIESVMPSKHLILCHPLLLLPSIFPSIRVFPSEEDWGYPICRMMWKKDMGPLEKGKHMFMNMF